MTLSLGVAAQLTAALACVLSEAGLSRVLSEAGVSGEREGVACLDCDSGAAHWVFETVFCYDCFSFSPGFILNCFDRVCVFCKRESSTQRLHFDRVRVCVAGVARSLASKAQVNRSRDVQRNQALQLNKDKAAAALPPVSRVPGCDARILSGRSTAQRCGANLNVLSTAINRGRVAVNCFTSAVLESMRRVAIYSKMREEWGATESATENNQNRIRF